MLRSNCVGAEHRIELTSGFVRQSWFTGLSEVLLSPSVWMVASNGYLLVDVLPSTVKRNRRGMNDITFVIRDAMKMKIQKF